VEMVVLEDPECQLPNHQLDNKVEASTGKLFQNAFQLAKLIQLRLKLEQSYGEDLITTEMDIAHSLSARRDSVMLSRMMHSLRLPQLS